LARSECKEIMFGKHREECGVFGIYSNDNHDVARLTYYALYALQHRGQESAGIAVNDRGTIVAQKDTGLVPDIFNDVVLNHLKGQIAIGHVKYSPGGRENVQPTVFKYKVGQLAIAFNGAIINAMELRAGMEESGAIFQTTSDTEVIANLISRFRLNTDNIEHSLEKVMETIKGAYAVVMVTPKKLVGFRDPNGIRPLCLGKLDNSYLLASESSALDAVGATMVRDINPGEIVVIDENGIRSIQTKASEKSHLCIFEFVYFARPDSIIDGASVIEARIAAGRQLAIEHPVDADIVIGAPDGGLNAALGFSRQSGIPYGQGLLKNKYVGRTFIQPEQGLRETGVRIKFNVIKAEIEGKRVVMVDDSIVRGTTTRRIVQMLKDAGAKEVHMRVSSPPYKFPCYFGIDVTSTEQLVASKFSVEEIREQIGADSLGYLSQEGLVGAYTDIKCGYCTACFDGKYPVDIPKEVRESGGAG